MFGKTLVHEFPMSYSHTEWYLPFSRGEIVYRPKVRLSKSNLTNKLTVLLSIFTAFLASFSMSLWYFIFAVAMCSVGDNTLHEFHISYDIMNGKCLLFFQKRDGPCLGRSVAYHTLAIIIVDFTLLAGHHWRRTRSL